MITPRFRLWQDAEFLYVIIDLPYVKISDVEVVIDGSEFIFSLQPYYLKLIFSHQIKDDARSKGTYDVGQKEVTYKISKAEPGVWFENLDLLANLLSPKPAKSRGFVEVLSGQEYMEQVDDLSTSEHKYGFSRQFQNFFEHQQEAQYELVDFDPDVYPASTRGGVALALEQEDFEVDRYLADMDDETIAEVLEKPTSELFAQFIPSIEETMSDLQLDAVVRLGNRDLLVNPALIPCLFLQCLDISYAFCYEFRSMDGELSCESAWTINKLSSTLSCMIEFTGFLDVVTRGFRRALVYPLYRSEALAKCALKDVKTLVKAGKATLLRVFLAIKHDFERSEPRYLLNKLFIDDMAIWLQKVDSGQFYEFQTAVKELRAPTLEELALDFSIKES